ILFLLVGVIAFFIVSIVFLPILKSIVTTPVLEPPVVGVITSLFGFLPEQCSVLTTTECRFCLIAEKILPLVVNTVFGLILFSVILGLIGGPRLGWRGKEVERAGETPTGLVKNFGIALLISLALSIFLLHQDPFIFINPLTFILGIVVRVLLFMVNIGEHTSDIRRLTDFFLAAYILVFGWSNWWWIFIIPLGTMIWATAVTPPRGETNIPLEGMRMGPSLLVLLVVSIILGFYVYAIFEHQWWTPLGTLPTKVEFHGLPSYIIEKANLPELKGLECGRNTIGPESSISI
ncbi:MAG: hypothetical protein FD167_5187, partial [bacterium]